jgi:hypothetical protein
MPFATIVLAGASEPSNQELHFDVIYELRQKEVKSSMTNTKKRVFDKLTLSSVHRLEQVGHLLVLAANSEMHL